MHVGWPTPAYAWFGWLDGLSGPGPFVGGEFDFKLVCFVDTPRWTDAVDATVAARAFADARKKTLKSAALDGVKLDAFSPQTLTERIANAPASGREAEMLKIAGELTTEREAFSKAVGVGNNGDVVDELDKAASLWRESTQPRVSVFPGSIAWASCLDNPKNSTVSPVDPKTGKVNVYHGDRRPAPALVINYRQLYTTNTAFASGNQIVLRIVEPKFSWPLSGSFDFLDGQAGIGRYWFTSDGFATQTGWIVEPVRLDLHFPARFADNKPWFPRAMLAFSYSAGVVMFPRGFQAGAFGAGTSAYAGSEAIFEQGVVFNIGRLLR